MRTYYLHAMLFWLDVSEYVVSSIAYSLGLLSKPFVLNDFSKEYKLDNQFCGHWIFRYNKSKIKGNRFGNPK